MEPGDAVVIDGLSLKIQARNCKDFTMSYISLKKTEAVLDDAKLEIETSTIFSRRSCSCQRGHHSVHA